MKLDANDIQRQMGLGTLREVIDRAPDPEAARKQQKRHAKPNGKQLVVYDASSVDPKAVKWIWPGRIAIGKTTLVGGDPGLGKSQFSIFAAATVSQAGEWPCEEGRSPKRSVIMLSAEDGVRDTIVPRLMAAGADLEKVKIVTAVHEEDGSGRRIFNLTQDLDALEALVTRLGDVGLVIIDPVDAYIGANVDSHKNAAVRAVLEPISEMADRLGVAILALTHFSKQTANRAIYRFIGSIAQIGAARIAFAVVADPEDKTRILLLHAKNNLAPPQNGLAFRIQQHLVTDDGVIGSSVFFEPKHVTDVSADEALAAENGAAQTTAKDEVKEFLSTILANGRVTIPNIEAEARRAGLLGEDKQMRQSKPFRSAKNELQIISTREGFGPNADYYWSLPDQSPNPDTGESAMCAPEAPMCAHHINRAHMENEGAHDEPSAHARPQTPCAPSFCEGAYEERVPHKGAHAGNGQGATIEVVSSPDDDLAIPAFLDRRGEVNRVCVQCQARPDGKEEPYRQGDALVWLHPECRRYWLRDHPGIRICQAGRNGPMAFMGSCS